MAKLVVVGGGIAGLSTAFFLSETEAVRSGRAELALLEKEKTLGGPIGTDGEDGYLIERGPQGFLDNSPPTLTLIEKLGLTGRLVRAASESKNRYIYKSGNLLPVPTTPPAFLLSSLLSLGGRLRVAAEYFVPPKRTSEDESIFSFAARRIGPEAASVFVDALTLGVFAGRAKELSLSACFPKMAEMENKYGGLLKAAFKKKGASPFGPRGTLANFKGGLAELINALEARLSGVVKKGREIVEISGHGAPFLVRTQSREGKESWPADRLILALPSNQAAAVLKTIDLELSGLLASVSSAPVAVVVTSFNKDQIESRLEGFGFLVPSCENRPILGSLWSSCIFPQSAPEGKLLWRTFIGGTLRPELVEKSDSELVSLTLNELSPLLGIRNAPLWTKVYRYARALPQYRVGHPELLEKIGARLTLLPGFYLTGSSYRGAGINDCIRDAEKTARAVQASLDSPKPKAAV